MLKKILIVIIISMLVILAGCSGKVTGDVKTTSGATGSKLAPAQPTPAAPTTDSVSQISGAVTDASSTEKDLSTDDADKAVSGTSDALKDW